jgi:cytochrome c2
MKRSVLFVALLVAAGSTAAAFLPGDSAKGKAIVEKQCTSCHDSSVYTRPDRRVHSVEGLIGQVNGCVRQTGVKLDRDQINDVVNYLDETYYHFE